MKIDFTKVRDNLLGYCIINAAVKKDENIENIWPNLDAKNLDIQFIINGVELPLIQSFDDIQKQIDDMVNKKALEIVKEKLGDITEAAYLITEEIKRIAEGKLGIRPEDY